MKDFLLEQQKIPYVPAVLQKLDLWRMNRKKSVFEAPTSPHFGSQETTDFFRKILTESSFLLEFGAGGSTYLAAQLGIPFITVESDKGFLDLMKEKIRFDHLLNLKSQIFLHRSIGETRRWGRPLIIGKVSEDRRVAMKNFSNFPEEFYDLPSVKPIILIDGRYRVACALKAIRFLHERDFTLLVDDYRSRRTYRRIADFANLTGMVGRMAMFQPRAALKLQDIERAIYDTELDWR